MPVVAVLMSAWVVWRWLGFVIGLVRVRRFEGPIRREARRTVVGRGALNVFLSVIAGYLWASIFEVQLSAAFNGFLAALVMFSAAVGIASAFMQPAERTPETLDVCRVLGRS